MEKEGGGRPGVHSGSDGTHERPHPVDEEGDGIESSENDGISYLSNIHLPSTILTHLRFLDDVFAWEGV